MNQQTNNTAAAPLFYWNGIKDAKGAKLQGASYSDGRLLNYPAGTLTIYGKRIRSFSSAVHEAFTVENNTDSQTDYFENDRIRVMPTHPLYPQVLAACRAQEAHFASVQAKRAARRAGGAA